MKEHNLERGMLLYDNFLTRQECEDILRSLTNHNGTKGPKWADPEAVWQIASLYGIPPELPGRYNRWAFLVTVNTVWSDGWGVLRLYISRKATMMAAIRLSHALLTDIDGNFRIRDYFGI